MVPEIPRPDGRNVTDEPDPRERFRLFRLCECSACGGSGKQPWTLTGTRCSECRGEGRVRQELATCATSEAVGLAIVTLAREGEFQDCPIGLLDSEPPCETCGGSGDDLNPYEGQMVRCHKCNGSGIKATGTWLILPWQASPRNTSDAGRLLARSKKSTRTG